MPFFNIVISLKSSDIYKTVEAYELISQKVDYPLHIGITESGSVKKGTIKSSIGVGALLLKGIGDTVRISLTGDPCEEVVVGKEILRSLDLLNDKIKVVSCPTCGRCNIDLISVVNKVEEKIHSAFVKALDRFSFILKKVEPKLQKGDNKIDLKEMLLNTIGNNKGYSDNNAEFTLK